MCALLLLLRQGPEGGERADAARRHLGAVRLWQRHHQVRCGPVHSHERLCMYTAGCMHEHVPPAACLCIFARRAQVYETATDMAAEEDAIRRHTTPAYRPPEVRAGTQHERVACTGSSRAALCAARQVPHACACLPVPNRLDPSACIPGAQMWDLYQRQRIDTKADIWVRAPACTVTRQAGGCLGARVHACLTRREWLSLPACLPARPPAVPHRRQALGVLLFVLCFGRLPFTGDSKLAILNAKYEMPPAQRPPQVRRRRLAPLLLLQSS